MRARPVELNGDAESWRNYECDATTGIPVFSCRIHGTPVGGGDPVVDPRVDRAFGVVELVGLLSAYGLELPPERQWATRADIRSALHSQRDHVRHEAAIAARFLGDRELAEDVLPILGDFDEYARKQAAWTLGVLGDDCAVPALRTALDDPVERVRDFAAFALARLHDPEGVRRTDSVLRDDRRQPIRRGEAAIALGDAGAQEEREVFRRILDSPAPAELRERIALALERLDERSAQP
jgi:hypothetical protein